MAQQDVQSLSPAQAFEMIKNDARAVLFDIRSSMEFLFVGHPKGAVHIAWIDEPDWDINPTFVVDIRKVLLGGVHGEADAGSAPVILICRSGKRSLEAGRLLIESGFNNIFHVDEGFEGERDDHHHRSTVGGWRYHNLPWEQC